MHTDLSSRLTVLSEVAKPRRTFAKAVSITTVYLVHLVPLINVEASSASPRTKEMGASLTTLLLLCSVGSWIPTPRAGRTTRLRVRGMNAVLAIFIFGNLLAQTYSWHPRSEQEIVKEGILPYSLTSSVRLERHAIFSTLVFVSGAASRTHDGRSLTEHSEQAPKPATVLHWAVECVLHPGPLGHPCPPRLHTMSLRTCVPS